METSTLVSQRIDWDRAAGMLPFRKAAVLGAGTMGAQIAMHMANAGLDVYLLDIAPGDGKPNNSVVQSLFKRASKLKPAPLFQASAAKRIKLGNFEDNLAWLGEVELIVEAVVERLDIKRSLMEKVEAAAGPDTIICTNTSGLPIKDISEGRSADFKRRFFGTHFFNPPRYLKLLEIIPTPDTDWALVERVAQFGRVHLGKGIVVCKDTPNFIGNRIGVFAMMQSMAALEAGYSIEEVDTLTGPLSGKPKSATFRTADVVGLDTMRHVAVNLYDLIPDDESREVFKVPAILDKLVEGGALGAKTKAGFYKKVGKDILSINPASGEYEPAREMDIGDVGALKKAGGLGNRLRALYADQGRAGAFFRSSTHKLLAYSAMRVPEIADNPADIDRATRWGFGWEVGPFETWDALGFDTVIAGIQGDGLQLPGWIEEMKTAGVTSFYQGDDVYIPGQGYASDEQPPDEFGLALIKTDAANTLWENEEAALLDMGNGVALYEFRSKANSLGARVMQGLMTVLDKVEQDPNIRGLVIANEGKNFSVGANLGEMGAAAVAGKFSEIEASIAGFQGAVERIRYALKPVVVVPHQRVLGGGCEMVMASTHPVAASESYIGLVELGAGLIPAGTGTAYLAALASDRAPDGFPSQILNHVQAFFQNVAMAKVSASAREAQEMGLLAPHAHIVMNEKRRFHVAKHTVIGLSEAGYLPPPRKPAVKVLGKPGKAALSVAARQFEAGKFISAYDRFLAEKLAHVITGGDLSGPQEVPVEYLIDLEREVFVSLLGEEKTQERIKHILTTNRPLRN